MDVTAAESAFNYPTLTVRQEHGPETWRSSEHSGYPPRVTDFMGSTWAACFLWPWYLPFANNKEMPMYLGWLRVNVACMAFYESYSGPAQPIGFQYLETPNFLTASIFGGISIRGLHLGALNSQGWFDVNTRSHFRQMRSNGWTDSPLERLKRSKRQQSRVHTGKVPKFHIIIVSTGDQTSTRRVES